MSGGSPSSFGRPPHESLGPAAQGGHPLVVAVASLIPGAAQGCATVLLGHPLDTMKTRMQAGGPLATSSLLRTGFTMLRVEGPRSFYRGATPPLLMEGAKRSVQFALWDIFRGNSPTTRLSAHGADDSGTEAIQWSEMMRRRFGENAFLSGALAGGIGTIIGCPMHVIKIQTQNESAATTRNAWSCAVNIRRREGLRGYYRGFPFHFVKDIFFAGCYLGLYDALRDHTFPFVAGAAASVATWALLYPLDTIKTVVQARHADELGSILRSPTRLYRGLLASLLRAGPVAGASMVVYEAGQRFLHQVEGR